MVLAFVAALTAAGSTSLAGGKAAKKGYKFSGTLSQDDPKDTKRNTPCKIHVVPLKKGTTYVIDMIGIGFDAYLRLEDKAGKELAEDDDSGGNLNAQIIFNCSKDGNYRVICTCFANANGKYNLIIKARGAFSPGASHAILLGKVAPDIEGDFAVNGKSIKLSDLKGKVVLLDFWAVQSSTSVAALPRLREWHKLHRDDGFEVVGVTYFNSELGHKLAFDPDAGRVKNIAAASPESDRALLTAFAAYHKLDHVLLALHRDKALKTFNDYLVNSLPMVVLIDRKGLVRFTFVGDLEGREQDVNVRIKKLLDEPKERSANP
jgi:hypothetical protein